MCIGEVDRVCNGLHTVEVPSSFRITQEQMFVNLVNGKPCSYLPSLEDGVKCQKILDAILLSSKNKKIVELFK